MSSFGVSQSNILNPKTTNPMPSKPKAAVYSSQRQAESTVRGGHSIVAPFGRNAVAGTRHLGGMAETSEKLRPSITQHMCHINAAAAFYSLTVTHDQRMMR